MVLGRRRVQRRPFFLPVGNQLVEGPGLHDRTGQDMGADLDTLLQDDDREIDIILLTELLQPDRGRETGWPGADRDDIIFHRFARLIAQGPR